jgi:hypothetical protein
LWGGSPRGIQRADEDGSGALWLGHTRAANEQSTPQQERREGDPSNVACVHG